MENERNEGLELGVGGGAGKPMGDGLPREPEKCILSGHRARITKIALHPIYSLVASASEDTHIRLWDYE